MKIIKCWRLESIGEERDSLVARFASEEEAVKAGTSAKGYGPKITEERITIYNSAIEFDPRNDVEAVESGLAKLTERERRALGITPPDSGT